MSEGSKIQLVLNNLISNGIKYSPKGAKIIIWSEMNKDRVKVSVENTSLGLSIVSTILDYHKSEDGVSCQEKW